MNGYDLYKDRSGKLPRAEFLRRFEGLYLLACIPEQSDWGFQTGVAGPMDQGFGKILENEKDVNEKPGTVLLQKLEKSTRNSWVGKISVGRALNNDIVLRHESVSKLHAYFFEATRDVAEEVEEIKGGIRQEAGKLMLVDADSANGTVLNGRKLSSRVDEGEVVSVGDEILFGEVDCVVLDGSGLYNHFVSGTNGCS